MKTIELHEAEIRFYEIMQELLETGETIRVLDRGKPMVDLILNEKARDNEQFRREIFEELKQLCEEEPNTGLQE